MILRTRSPLLKRTGILLMLSGSAALVLTLFMVTAPVRATPSAVPPASPQNEACLTCHNRPDQERRLPSGEILTLTIDREHFSSSVHAGISCTDCHTGISGFPHPVLEARTRREVSMQLYTTCQNCHADQYDATLDSVHQRALAGGNTNAAICTDCHDPHSQAALTGGDGALLPQARVSIPETCARCHSTIYQQYQESVHGAALIGEGNQDVPTCIDCHGVHNISDPTAASFTLQSPELCASCHTQASIMDKYGISTSVLSTYVSDFHGSTVTLFEQQGGDQVTDKPVCYTCHGIHDIRRVDDPVYGLEMKENLLARCQQCHPEANANFPDAWMSHYIPSPEHYPIVYYVNLFYKFFIPGVLGPMTIFVISDLVRRLIERRKGAKQA